MQHIQLNDGNSIPALGYGVCAIGAWQQNDDYVTDVIFRAIEAGYRHFDTASLYGTERNLGEAMKRSGIPRSEFYIVSKVWDNEQGYNNTIAACERSLARLGLDYLDLYVIHWPVPEQTQATWQAMETLQQQGKIRSLGLSNFRISDIEQLLSFANIKPVYNQLELHPYMTQQALVEYCAQHEIAVSCWSPLGSGNWSGVAASEKPISDPAIKAIAEKYSVSTAQVILRWNIQQGRIAIPKSESDKNLQANLALFDFALSAEDIAIIDALNRNHRYGADPDTAYADNMQMDVPA